MARSTFASITGMPYGTTKEEHRAYFKWWRSLNREDYNKKRLDWANTNRERRTTQARNSYLKNKFDLSIDDFNKLLIDQENKCAICKVGFIFVTDQKGRNRNSADIDHNHSTNIVRGLLCRHCNTGLGLFKESPESLRAAADYIEQWKG